jgi:Ser-tRNA(Ala) deacylase AlaX
MEIEGFKPIPCGGTHWKIWVGLMKLKFKKPNSKKIN